MPSKTALPLNIFRRTCDISHKQTSDSNITIGYHRDWRADRWAGLYDYCTRALEVLAYPPILCFSRADDWVPVDGDRAIRRRLPATVGVASEKWTTRGFGRACRFSDRADTKTLRLSN